MVAARRRATGADVSHRGGTPGFLAVDGPSALSFPDYAGNGVVQLDRERLVAQWAAVGDGHRLMVGPRRSR